MARRIAGGNGLPAAAGPPLRDRVAIVTGAGRGIGREIALGFARAGAHVVAAARTASEIEGTAAEVRDLGRQGLALPCDVSRPAQVDALVGAVHRRFRRIDILVNNAGTFGPIGPVLANDRRGWIDTIMVNLGGTFLCTQAVLPVMVGQRSGKIINLSGGGAASPRPNFTAYSSSKAAVVRFTESLALEVAAYNIQVNAMAPGPVFTRLTESILEAGEAAGAAALEEARRQRDSGNPSIGEAVGLAVFLASDESCGLSGRFISAVWDDWRHMAPRIPQIMASDLCTLRRVESHRPGAAP